MFWTDSTCVIKYIRSNDKRFHTFVANRVAVIHDGSSPSQWKYVSSEANPADDASRGLTVSSVIKKNRWINGPDFLWQHESSWPAQPTTVKEIPDDDPEIKREIQAHFVVSNAGIDSMNQLFGNFSSWSRLKKIIAWVLRYRERLKASCKRRKRGSLLVLKSSEVSEPISVDEIDRAEKEVLKFVQRQSFQEEISCLNEKRKGNESDDSKNNKQKKSLIKKSSAIYKLDPVKIDGLLCVGGRLK